MNTPVIITAVHLNAYSNRIKISLEIDGHWVEILDEHHTETMHTSHIIEGLGILSRQGKVA